jgi:hypothetical protein
MSDKDTHLKNPETQRRLALLGLAAERRGAGQPCPDDQRFALLLEADPGSAEQQRFFTHLSECESCREKWLVLLDELERSSDQSAKAGLLRGRRGLLSLAGSVCAVAVGVMLYLSIDYHPVHFDARDAEAPERASQVVPADQDQAPAAETGRVDSFRKEAEVEKMVEADAGEIASEPKRHRRESHMEQPAQVKTSPAPQMTEAPEQRRNLEQVLSERQSFSVVGGAVEHPVQFKELLDSFLSYCDDRPKEGSRTAWSRDIVEKGEGLREPGNTITRDQEGLIDKIVQLLSSSEPVKDSELDKLCEEAGRMAAETDQALR